MSKSSDIVKQYLREHPDAPSRTIAKFLFGRYPDLFTSVDACYKRVLYYRETNGKQSRDHHKGADDREALHRVPAAAKKKNKPVALTAKGRWLIMGDLHVPYHDQRAVEAAIKFGVDNRCDHLLLNGDIVDAYQQSMWVKDPTCRQIDSEIKTASQVIKAISQHFKGEKAYKIGNHEERIESYLYMNAPKMIGMSKWSLTETLRKELDLGDSWQMIAGRQLYTLGKLHGYHGHELPRGLTNPVNVGRGLFLRTKQSGFTNHWHASSTHIETSGSKRNTWVCFSIGCLCDLHPNYAPVNGWNHGVAYVDIDSHGNYSESNHRIVDGEIW